MNKRDTEKQLIEIFNQLRMEVGDGIELYLNRGHYTLKVWHPPIEWTDEARAIIKKFHIQVVE